MPLIWKNRSPDRKTSFYYGYIVVAAAFLIMMITMGAYFSFGIFLKPLVEEFGWSRAVTSGLFSVSWMVHGPAGLILGTLNDKLGPRKVISFCAVLAGTGYLLMPYVNTLWSFYLIYALLIGFGSNTFIPIMSAIVRIFSRRRTVMAGITSTGIGIGQLIMSPLITYLVEEYGWRISFMILGGLVLTIVIIAAQFLRQDIAQEEPDTAVNTKTAQAHQTPIKDFSVGEAFHTVQFWMIAILFFCFGFCLFTIQVHIVPYVTDTGFPAQTAALVLSTIGAASVIGRSAGGALGDIIGNAKAFIVAFALMLISLIILVPCNQIWCFFIIAVIFGIAYGNGVAQESPIIAGAFGLKYHGLIFGLLGVMYAIGAATGPILAGYLFDISASYHLTFIITSVIAAVATIAAALFKPTDPAGS